MSDKVEVPFKQWSDLHRAEGYQAGLLIGWLGWDGTPEHMERLKRVTQEWLDERGDTNVR